MINQLLRFKPILKEKIWGGEKLKKLLNKKSDKINIGESWEISDVDGDESIISNRFLKGRTLRDVQQEYKQDLVGNYVYDKFGDEFPLLIKFIDAKDDLSIQVHPSEGITNRGDVFHGKTEMWYVVQSDEESNIIIGFKKKSNEKEYLHHLSNKTLLDILNVDKVKKGDAYFVPTGRVHAIGKGLLIAEIQQTSDVTYRIYDWDRKNIDGNYRKLHPQKALTAIDFKTQKSYKTHYLKEENSSLEIVSCPYFTVNILPIKGNLNVNLTNKDSFVIYMCVEGEVTFNYNYQIEKIKMGETILIPACIKKLEFFSEIKSDLLEIFISE